MLFVNALSRKPCIRSEATVSFLSVYNFQCPYPRKPCTVTSWFPRLILPVATYLPIRFLETAHMSQYAYVCLHVRVPVYICIYECSILNNLNSRWRLVLSIAVRPFTSCTRVSHVRVTPDSVAGRKTVPDGSQSSSVWSVPIHFTDCAVTVFT
jgi:hypothetical protein